MATHDYVIDNASGATVRSDVNAALSAIATQNSGTAWATTYARMRVADTAAGVVKRRNAANSAWIDVETDDETFVIDRTANTIWDRSDRGKCFRVTGSYTQTLDAAATLGDGWSVAVRVESGATLTIDPNAAETIDGSATKAIAGPAAGRVWCNGSAVYTEGFVSVAPLTTTAPRVLENLGLSVAMAANAVTVALKGADGNDPSASNKVGIGFRSATITSGAASKVEVTAATSVAISSGSTLGTTSALVSRIWIAAINNAGAVELAVYNAGDTGLSPPVREDGLISTTAEGGAGGADTVRTWYSTTARSNVPFTLLGYFDSTQATAGTWATAAATVAPNPRVTPGVTLGAVVDTSTGATSYTVTGLPTGVKEIDFAYGGISTNGTATTMLRVGPSGGVVNAGYAGALDDGAAVSNPTDGFYIDNIGAAAAIRHGRATLRLIDPATNTWSWNSQTYSSESGRNGRFSSGTISLSGPLERFQLIGNGTDTFDAGKLNYIAKE